MSLEPKALTEWSSEMIKRIFGLVSSAAAANTLPMNIAAVAASVREIFITMLVYGMRGGKVKQNQSFETSMISAGLPGTTMLMFSTISLLLQYAAISPPLRIRN